MKRRYGNQSMATYWSPLKKLFVLGGLLFVTGIVLIGYGIHLRHFSDAPMDLSVAGRDLYRLGLLGVIFGGGCIICSILGDIHLPEKVRLQYMLRERLFAKSAGNPLGLKSDSVVPFFYLKKTGQAQYRVMVETSACSPDVLVKMPKIISAGLVGPYAGWAVTLVDEDPASSYVAYIIEDVSASKKLIVDNVYTLATEYPYQVTIQDGFFLDLRKSGSILICGKTRSGKTTAVEAMLMSILLHGPDQYSSTITIIDPKNAELSTLPHVISPSHGGDAHAILRALKNFNAIRMERQAVLNALAEKRGVPVHWWETNMAPAILFMDEWVALQSLFPKRAVKEDSEYCQQTLHDLVRIIVTMGASAGCYVILSTAEASVEAAGVPSMIRAAMGTKILMRPTRQEGALLWSTEKMEVLPERRYAQGDAWLSSTDGVHDDPTFVQFPALKFEEYSVLKTLLNAYYE